MLSMRKNSNLDEKVEVVGEEKKQKNRVLYLKRMIATSKQKFGKSKSPPPEESAAPVSLPNPISEADGKIEEVSKDCELVPEQVDGKTAIVVVAETEEKLEKASNKDCEVVVPEQHLDATTVVGVAERVQTIGTDSSWRGNHQSGIGFSVVSVSTIGVDKADSVSDNETPIAPEPTYPAPVEEVQKVENITLSTAGAVEVEVDRNNRVRFNESGVPQRLRPYHPRNFRDRYYFGAKSMHRQQARGLLARSLDRNRNSMPSSEPVVRSEILRSGTVARPVGPVSYLKNYGSNPLFEGGDDDYTFDTYDDATEEDTYFDDMATADIMDKTGKDPSNRIFCGFGNTAIEIACGTRQMCHSENTGGHKSVSNTVDESEISAPVRTDDVNMPPDPNESKNDNVIVRKPKPDPPSCALVRASRAVPKKSCPPARARADPAPSLVSPQTPRFFAKATPVPQAPSSKTPARTKTTKRDDHRPPALPRVIPVACGAIASAAQCGAMEPQEADEGLTLFNPLDEDSLMKDGDETYDDDTMTRDPTASLISSPVDVVDVDTLLTEPNDENDWFEKKVDEYSGVLNAIDTIAIEIAEVPDTIANEICTKCGKCGGDQKQKKKEKKAFDKAVSDLMLTC